MYNNCLNKGIESQKRLYGSYGDQVVDVFRNYHESGYSKDFIVKQMTDKINSLGASNVSKHCGDYTKLNVIDIAPSSIKNHDKFTNCIANNTSITQYYTPKSNDPAFHIEIPQ